MKSHFQFSNKQRSGIFLLLAIIIIAQCIYAFVDFSEDGIPTNQNELDVFKNELDSLRLVEIKNNKPKIYPFNPNYITDYKGYTLGMSNEEIDRLHKYRATNKWVNSAKEFQQVTKVSDSLLNGISPLFKFPDWIKERKKNNFNKTKTGSDKKSVSRKQVEISTTDINLATAGDLRIINGIGEKLSERIIKYRKRLQGFTFEEQLYEVWGVDQELADQVLEMFKIISKPDIQKININTASFKEVLSVPYIDYDLCKKIFAYRDEIAEFQSLEELRNINNFPLDKYTRIALYLLAE